eukprot:c4867_g1_i1 orf=17-997(-)
MCRIADMGVLLLFVCALSSLVITELVLGMEAHFYDTTCPNAEAIIFSMVRERYSVDKSIAPGLIRLLFHDCFVTGCDASILLNSTAQSTAEKDAPPNASLRGFDLIDKMKETLEQKCPETVSCADIIAIAARDAVALSGGQHYELLLGRHDGMVSLASETATLPDVSSSLPEALAKFKANGFTTEEFVALLGTHTIGTTHCKFIQDRLFNYKGTGKPDPTMEPAFAQILKQQCSTSSNHQVYLDQTTPFVIDNNYFSEAMQGRGVLAIDNEVEEGGSTRQFVETFAREDAVFQTYLEHSMKKLSMLNVLTHEGETRKRCYEINWAS